MVCAILNCAIFCKQLYNLDPAINEEALKNKLKKKASVVFERKASDGSSFWSLSARNSVTSMFEATSDQAEDGPEASEASEAVKNPRKLLQKKRSSLAHKPDPSTLDRKESIQQPEAVYEFQKVTRSKLSDPQIQNFYSRVIQSGP